MKVLPNLLAAAVLAALSAPAFADVEIDVIGGSEISFEGLVQTDGYWYDNDVAKLGSSGGTTAGDGIDTDFGMRRAELVFKGKGPGMWNWVIGYDARADKFLDTNVSYKFGGFTTLKFGQYKQPNSLEELSSTKNNDFVSKAMTTNMQAVGRRVGLGLGTGAPNWTVSGSLFSRELTRNLGQGDGFGARGTWAPILEEGNYLHLGLSYVDYEARLPGSAVNAAPPKSNGDNEAQWRVRPDADLTGVRLINSGTFTDADRNSTFGAELAWVHGPFKLQGEYMGSQTTRSAHDDFKLNSWYLSGVWNITGETWGYKDGVVTTGLPKEPASGMWQVGLRYDKADLNDGSVGGTPSAPVVTGVLGGEESNWTAGVNWYWRSNFKLALNYVWASSEKWSSSSKAYVQDDPGILELRAQIYW
jgi:phosphate-selective porin OprO/OprP